MPEEMEEIREKVLEYLEKHAESVDPRKMAKILGYEKKKVDEVIRKLIEEGKAQYVSYGGASYIKLIK